MVFGGGDGGGDPIEHGVPPFALGGGGGDGNGGDENEDPAAAAAARIQVE